MKGNRFFCIKFCLLFFIFVVFVRGVALSLDPRYYDPNNDDADREYYLEQERLELEEKRKKQEEKRLAKKGIISYSQNNSATKNSSLQGKNGNENEESDDTEGTTFLNSDFINSCNYDITRLCKIRRKNKSYQLKNATRCKNKLMREWKRLTPNCQVFLSSGKSSNSQTITRTDFYVGNGIKLSQTQVNGKTIRKPRRSKTAS